MLVMQQRPDILLTPADSRMSSKSLKRPSNTIHFHQGTRIKNCHPDQYIGLAAHDTMGLPVIEEDKVSSIRIPPPYLSDAISEEDDSGLSSSHNGGSGSRTSSHSSVSDVATHAMSDVSTIHASSDVSTTQASSDTSSAHAISNSPTNTMPDVSTTHALSEVSTIHAVSSVSTAQALSDVSTIHALSNVSTTQALSDTSSIHAISDVSATNTISDASIANTASDISTTHTIPLSSLEHCMPRAYIRICFAYRTHSKVQLDDAIERLKIFVRKTIDAKPYLAGSVVNSTEPDRSVGQVEISFGEEEFLKVTALKVKELLDPVTGKLIEYDDLARDHFPPSKLRPEEVAILPTDVHEQEQAPIFKVQANIVRGGLIVSLYLHHCISDGKGFDLLATGDIMRDESAFQRDLNPGTFEIPELNERLRAFAKQKAAFRMHLSYPSPNQINTRDIKVRRLDDAPRPKNAPGRGCIIYISHQKITDLWTEMQKESSNKDLTRQNVLMALLWRYMTRARMPSVSQYPHVRTSKLLIPVDIRKRMSTPLPDGYFGAAVDSASAELSLDGLADSGTLELSQIARKVRAAIDEVDDLYVRQAISMALSQDRNIDVRDLQASNMDRVTGADMYITSWLKLRLYEAHMDMGLGMPEWVRKPWSRDPGSCIILPQRCKRPESYEVVVQMTEADMSRLLEDQEFGAFVTRVID